MIRKSAVLIVFFLNIQIVLFSQNIKKLDGVFHVSGLLNKSVVFCDTADVITNYETLEILSPVFVIKNLVTNQVNVLYHESKPVDNLCVKTKGDLLIISCGGENEYKKYIAKVGDNGEIIKSFGKNGFVLLSTLNNEQLEYIDIIEDSIGNVYVLQERTLTSGFIQPIIFKYLKNGSLDLSFGNKGILISDKIANYNMNFMPLSKLSLSNSNLLLTCVHEKTGMIYTIIDGGKTILKSERLLDDFMMFKNIGGKMNCVISKNSIVLYDNELKKEIATLPIKQNNMLTNVYYNNFNNTCYFSLDGLGESVSRVYEVKNDNSVNLIFSSDKINEYSSTKDDHITGITFENDEVSIVLSVNESREEYTYENYLIQLK